MAPAHACPTDGQSPSFGKFGIQFEGGMREGNSELDIDKRKHLATTGSLNPLIVIIKLGKLYHQFKVPEALPIAYFKLGTHFYLFYYDR